MSGYLARLKAENPLPRALTKPTKAPFVSNVSTEGRPFSEISPQQPGGTATEDDLYEMIRVALKGLDSAGSWEGFHQRIKPEDRQRIRATQARIDTAYGERDAVKLAAALIEHRTACLQVRGNQTNTEA